MMEITKEKFNKLKQLDRIEFRQKQNNIIERYKHSISLNFLGFLIIMGTLFIMMSMNIYHMGSAISSLRFARVGSVCFTIAMLWFFIDVVLGLVYVILEKRDMKKLVREYFNFKIGVKKR